MSGKTVKKTVIDFPDGLLFVRPEDSRCIKREKRIKSVNIKEALKYAKNARIKGKGSEAERYAAENGIKFEDM